MVTFCAKVNLLAMRLIEIGGENLTTYFRDLLKQKLKKGQILTPLHLRYDPKCFNSETKEKNFKLRNESISSSIEQFYEMLVARNAKENALHWVPMSEQKPTDNSYEMPDGERVSFESSFSFERNFFDRKDVNPASVELQNVVAESLQACDVDIRKNVVSGIVLAGGNTLIPKFKESFEEALGSLAFGNAKAKLICPTRPADRKTSGWTGASILASTGAFQNMWISKAEYEEHGQNVIFRKCLN